MRICAFIGDMYRDYPSAIIRTLLRLSIEKGHHIDIFGNCAVPNENPLHAEGLKSILAIPPLKEYDGIILCSDTLNHAGIDKELLEHLMTATDIPPIVNIRSDESGFYNILPDNRQLMHDITEYVIGACGNSDIGFVTGRDDLKDSSERRAGWEDAMREAGYEPKEEMVFHGNYWIDKASEMADFFTREDGTLPSAIICSNDYMALTLMDELVDRGYQIPSDTMVTGVDNLEDSALHIPSLTTLEIPEEVLASSAVDCLERIHNGEKVDIYTYLSGNIIVRESTGGTTERDLYETYRRLELIQHTYYHKSAAFVEMNSDYEDIMSIDECLQTSLKKLQRFGWFKECCFCQYNENDRALIAYGNKTCIKILNISYPQTDLLPKDYDRDEPGIRVFLPFHFKNVVYGYGIFTLDPGSESFFDERLEFMLLLIGQTFNRLNLYTKLYEANDVFDLYVRDALTGIYNRRGFEKALSALFEKDLKLAVASIDMDDLKYINDTFGHSIGDEAIQKLTGCLTSSLNENEFVARMGGDEFEAVLVLDNPGRIGQFIRSVRNAIKKANEGEDIAYTLSASIGTCELTDWSSLMECMNKADKVMYLEKKTKKSR